MGEISFKEFFYADVPERSYSEVEVAHMYFQGRQTVREIANSTSKSMGEVYRIIHSFGQPNRRRKDQSTVISLADSGMGVKTISDFTGYTTRHVRNILKKGK